MKLNRIYGLILRYYYLFTHSYERMIEGFLWPSVDIILWGITSKFISEKLGDSNGFVIMVLTGIVLWIFVNRNQVDMSVNMLEEFWNRNLVNLFVAPVKLGEWVLSLILFSLFKVSLTFLFTTFLVYILYQVEIYKYGIYLLPFALSLSLTGWWMGFLINSLILRFGTKVQMLGWGFITVLTPFSAMYYPLNSLPEFAQNIAHFVPTSYIFEGAREVMATGNLDMNKFYISLILNIIYMAITLIFLKLSFTKILEKGLVKVY